MASTNSRRLILPKTHAPVSIISPNKSNSESNTKQVIKCASSSSSFRTIAPRLSQNSSVVNSEVTEPNDFNEKDVVHYGDIESGNQDLNMFRNHRVLYANSVVPRNHLRVTHRRVLLPSHTIPRTPINADTLPSGPCQSGFDVNEKGNLRPTVQFLLRIGSALVRSQYESAVADEVNSAQSLLCNRRKRRRIEEKQTHPTANKSTVDSVNISHLEWKPKARHSRWEKIWNYCHDNKCPYVPTSALQLLRHLEQGHQKLVNIDPVNAPRRTRPERLESCDSALSSTLLYGDELMGQFHVPLTVNVSEHLSSTSTYTCPVCGQGHKTQHTLENHLRRNHVELTLQLIEKPKVMICSVCGLPTQSTLIRNSSYHAHSGVSLHLACKHNESIHNNAPWSGCDAHPLACLMLYPTLYSRFGLPFKVARFLYTLTQHMLMARVNQFGGWSVQSYTLRCCAGVSAIFGELVDPNTVKPFIHSKMSRILEDKNCVQALVPDISVIPNSSLCTSNPLETNQLDSRSVLPVLVSSSLLTQPNFALPSSVNPTNLSSVCVVPTPPVNQVANLASRPVTCSTLPPTILLSQPTPTIGQKRPLTFEPTFPVCVTVTKQPNVSVHGNTQIPAAPWPTISSNATVVSFLPSQSKVSIQPKPPMPIPLELSSDELSQQSSLSNGDANTVRIQLGPNGQIKRSIGNQPRSLPRVLPMSEIPCELCTTNIPTETNAQRFHIFCHHKAKGLARIPTFPCNLCGQLFWTNAGLGWHQKGSCTFCKETKLCSSTFYLHEIIKHPQQFAHLLTQGVYNCPRCCRIFPDMTSFIIHIQVMHFFTVPDDLNALCRYDLSHGQTDCDNVTIGPKISNLLTLYSSLSLSTSVAYTLPENVAVYCKSNGKTYMKCSVCSSHFLTTSHLDLHMAQASHQYWCRLCPYACERAISLWKHYCGNHKREPETSRPTAAGKLYRIVKSNSLITTKSSSESAVTASTLTTGSTATIITSASKQTNQRRALGHLSQFHGCDLCPVFCLTIEDLNTHKKTAHATEVSKDSTNLCDESTVSFAPSSTTNTTTATTKIMTSSSVSDQSVRLTVTTTSSSSVATGINSRLLNAKESGFTSKLTDMLINNPPSNEQSICRSILVENNNVGSHTEASGVISENTSNKNSQVIDEISINDDDDADEREGQARVGASGDNDDDVICPMCEFHSKLRSDVMQHIMDSH